MESLSLKLNEPDTLRSLAYNLNNIATIRRLSHDELAQRIGISRIRLDNILAVRTTITVDLMVSISTALEVSPELLLKYFFCNKQREAELRSWIIGDTPMPDVGETAYIIPFARLNDPLWRQNFGDNVRACLSIQEKSLDAISLAVDMEKDNLVRVLRGEYHINHAIAEAIRAEIGLPIGDLTRVYDNDHRRTELLTKEIRALSEPIKPVADKSLQMTSDGKFNLRDPLLRKKVAQNIERLVAVRFPMDTKRAFLQKVGKHESWLNNLTKDRVNLVEEELKLFAAKLNVTTEMILTGEGIDALEARFRKHRS